MKKPRRKRIDSVAEQARIFSASLREINPPAHIKLVKKELIFFDSIISEFAKVLWTNHTLELAAMMARNMYQLSVEQEKIRKEGSTLKEEKTGDIYASPRLKAVSIYSQNIVTMRRSLNLHAASNGMARNKKDWADHNKKAKAVESLVDSQLDDDLIARPN